MVQKSFLLALRDNRNTQIIPTMKTTPLNLAKINCPMALKTPDKAIGADFTIISASVAGVSIKTKNGTNIAIPISAFHAAIDYLKANNHYKGNPCKITARNSKSTAGPLCCAARKHTRNIRTIDYILPILAFLKIVEICGKRPNTTWLI